jgi:ferric reductase like protein
MKKVSLLYPLVVLPVFIPLLLSFVFGGYGQELVGQVVPISFGVFSYSLMLVEIFLSARPKILENKTGLQNVYAVHGVLALFVMLTAVVHIVMQIAKVTNGNIAFPTAPLGILGFLSLIIATLMGILHL